MGILIGLGIVGAVLIYAWVKLVNSIFNPLIKKQQRKHARRLKIDNPYIMAHKMKFENDAMYDEYLEWLSENGGDVPFDKWKTQEEKRAERKIGTKFRI